MAQHRSTDTGLSSYLARISRYPLLDRAQEQQLSRQYREHGDRQAREKLILSNLRLVVSIAKRFQRRGL